MAIKISGGPISLHRGPDILQINIKCLKIPPGRRQFSWLFTWCSHGVELWATKNKSSEQ